MELKMFWDGANDIFTGPEDKVDMIEKILDAIETAVYDECKGDFENLRAELNWLLDQFVGQVIEVLKKHGANCDCTLVDAIASNHCIEELVQLVNDFEKPRLRLVN